jgi:TatD DNase family protein
VGIVKVGPAPIANNPCSVNGCSMKTEANLAAVKAIPPGKIMFETGWSVPDRMHQFTIDPSVTDAPWCSMNANHASRPHIDTLPPSLRSLYFPPDTKPERFVHGKPVKGRNEPCAIGGVAWVLQRMNEGVTFERITERAWKNTVEVFGLDELKDASESAPPSTST